MKPDPRTSEKLKVRYCILAHLAENPDSGDTFKGIQWWLLDQWIKRQSPKVKGVLKELVNDGLVLEHKAGDGRIHYRLNQAKHREIQALLAQRSR